jgi:hypothetical protein
MFKSPMCAPGRRRCAILLSVGVALCSAASARAADGPPRQQPPGVHSIICTSDGGIRDDYLADQIANQINAHGGHVKDVKVLVNTCYGGGLADDFARIFDPNGACPGVPWVFGSAAEWYQQAWAFRAEWCTDPNANLGSKFTSALAGPQSGHSDPTPGAMRDGTTDNVSSDLATARQHDEAGPNHEQWESPVIAFGNGGENVTWNASGTSHEVILFGGLMNQPAYYNDMENMQTALQNLYGGAPHTIQVIPDGTIQDLLDGISAACANLDANTQLLLHFTDHGAYSIDVVEVMQAQGDPPPPYTIPDQREVVILLWPPIWPGWPRPDPNEPNDPNFPYDPNDPYGWGPKLGFYLLSPIESEQWSICLNDLPLPLPPGTLEGPVEAPVAWESIDPTENHLKIQAVGQPSGPFVFDAMELSSGPVAMATDPASTAPVSATLGYLFTAPWFPGSATPFEIPLQVDWPAWEPIGPLTYYYVDPRWGDHQGFWGVSGPQQTAALRVRLFSTDDPGELQHVVISADLMTNDPADNRLNAVVQPPDSGFAPPAAYQPQASHDSESGRLGPVHVGAGPHADRPVRGRHDHLEDRR